MMDIFSPETMPPGGERDGLMSEIITDYFKHYGIEPPSEIMMYEGESDKFIMFDDEWQIILYSKNKAEIKKALKKFKDYATEYHNLNATKINVNDMQRATIFKIMKRCTFGDYLNDMGISGSTKQNLLAGFVAKPVLQEIIKQFEKEAPRADVKTLYPEENKRKFIASKLKELLI